MPTRGVSDAGGGAPTSQLIGTFPLLGFEDHGIGVIDDGTGMCLLDPDLEKVGCDTIDPSRRGAIVSAGFADGSTIVYGAHTLGTEISVQTDQGPVVIPSTPGLVGSQVVGFFPAVEFATFGIGDQVDIVLRSKLDGSEVDRFTVDLASR